MTISELSVSYQKDCGHLLQRNTLMIREGVLNGNILERELALVAGRTGDG